MLAGYYRLHDLVKILGRHKTTLRNWEAKGFIPKAKKDNRGWRFYTEGDIEKIVDLIKKNNYFRRKLK